MRRSRRIRLRDLPGLLIGGVVQAASLFGGRYRRFEGAHVLVADEQGRILAVRTTYLGQGWMLPGGRIEQGETPHEAAARETREETGLRVAIERLMLIDARRTGQVDFVFAARFLDGELEPQLGEIAEAGWVSRSEIETGAVPLAQLLGYLDQAADEVVYLGLDGPGR